MSIVCPNAGELLLLRYIVNYTRDDTDHNVLHIYDNDVTPGESSTRSTFTEATAAGYAAITLVGTLWTFTQDAGVTTAVFSEQPFTFTTGVTAYGYYVTDTSDSLLWAEKFDGDGFAIPATGGDITITPKLTLE